MKKELYTYIMEFRGGTYITQVQSDSLIDSVLSWTLQIEKELDEIKFVGSKTIIQIRNMISNKTIDEPMPLTGLNNVWYLGISVSIGYLRINIVKTKNL
jgi:hypothetical protein